jgi:probable HAF family extracellular repeat protein
MRHGFIWDIDNGVKYLHDGDFSAKSINDKCQIIGKSPSASSNYFLWENGGVQRINVAIHAFKYHGAKMLEDGRVLIYDRPDLVIWNRSSKRRFHIKGLYDYESNDFGHAAGSYSTVPWSSDGWPGEFLPFVFQPEIGHISMSKLSISGDEFEMIDHVFGINNQGQIVGYAQIESDVYHAFVMTPKLSRDK